MTKQSTYSIGYRPKESLQEVSQREEVWNRYFRKCTMSNYCCYFQCYTNMTYWFLAFTKWNFDYRFGNFNSWRLVLCKVHEHITSCWWRCYSYANSIIHLGCTVRTCSVHFYIFMLAFCTFLDQHWIFACLSSIFYRYDGSIGSASRAMVDVDQFAWQLGRKNL